MNKSNLSVGQKFNPFKVFFGLFVPDALAAYKGLSKGSKMCYGKLSQYAGRDGCSFPSHKRLAEDLGVSDRQVRSYLSALVDAGFILVEKSFPTNRYHFLWHPVLEGGNPSPRERKYSSYKQNQNTNTEVNDKESRSSDRKSDHVDGNESVGRTSPRERKYSSYKYNQNTNTEVNDRDRGQAPSSRNDSPIREVGAEPPEAFIKKAQKRFSPEGFKLYEALIKFTPRKGNRISPREAFFWIVKYKFENVRLAFEMFLASRKSPRSVGAYVFSILKDNTKIAENDYDLNRRIIVDYKKLDQTMCDIKINRRFAMIDGIELEFNMPHGMFADKFSRVTLR